MKQITLDGKTIGVLQNKTIGYFNSATPDSPFSNFYQPQKPIELYWANGRLDYVEQKNAKILKFDSVEQVFAYGKAVTMGDKASALKIIHTHTNKPSTFKYLGRQVKNFDPAKWDKAAGKWMKLGMLAKFNQDDFAKRALIKTEGYKLGECNPYDKKWGLGVNINSNFDQALGQNKQGQLLMLVRDELQYKGQLTKQKAVQYQGDLTQLDLQQKNIIVQQVNCQNKMGAGLALNLMKKWPQIATDYHQFCQGKKPQDLLGKMNQTKIGNSLVVNSFSQLSYGRQGHFTNEKLLINNLKQISDYAAKNGYNMYVPDHIGAGLAGGNWQQIKQALDQMPNAKVVTYKAGQTPSPVGKEKAKPTFPKKPSYSISLTGHRPNKFSQFVQNGNPYDLNDPYYQKMQQNLEELIQKRLKQHPQGIECRSGMALGADQVWAKAICYMKQQYPDKIKFVADVPLKTQGARWQKDSQKLWHDLLDQADEINLATTGAYSPSCMEKRNQIMISNSNECIAVYNGDKTGGTANGVRDAEKFGCQVTRLNPADLSWSVYQNSNQAVNEKVHGTIQPARTVNNVTDMNKEPSTNNFVSQQDKGNVFSNLTVPIGGTTTYSTIEQPDVSNEKNNSFSFR